MDHVEEFVDERQKTWCIHCAKTLGNSKTNRDHVPSKVLLRQPYPPNLPVVPVCTACNEGFSLDEEYFAAFLSSVLSGSTDPDKQLNPRAQKILRHTSQLASLIEQSKREFRTRGGEVRLSWEPNENRVNRVILKNARGHAFFELGEPQMDAPTRIWTKPIASMTKEEFEGFVHVGDDGSWAEVGSRMLTRSLTGQDLVEGWVVVQAGVYEYSVAQDSGLIVRSIIGDYLASEVAWE